MTNIISYDFHKLSEIHPKTIYTQIFCNTFQRLNDDIMNHVYDFLVPQELDYQRLFQFIYETKDRNTQHTTIHFLKMPFYDFIIQFMKAIWFKHTHMSQDMIILPYLRNDRLLFTRNHLFDFHGSFPIHCMTIEDHSLSWMKLFIELLSDFHMKKEYHCLYYEYPKELNKKYINWLNINMTR